MNSSGKRDVSQAGLKRMFFRVEQVGRDELQAIVNELAAGTIQQFHTISYTPGNNSLGERRGPNNNLNQSERITVDNVERLFRQENLTKGIRAVIPDKYLAMICDYVNANQNPPRQLAGTIPFCTHLLRAVHANNEPDRNLWATQASETLTGLGYALPTFRNIRYLFVNLIIPSASTFHSMIIVISPEAQTLELLDSNHKDKFMYLYGDYFKLLNTHYGRAFIPSEWKMRVKHCVRQGRFPTCIMHSTSNAMCLAFGYDNMKIPRRDSLTNRRWLMARELMNGAFDSDPDSQFYYPIVPTEPDNDPFNGWTSLTPAVLAALPMEARARRGKYSGPQWATKASITRHCRKNMTKYRGFSTWSTRPLVEYIEQVELRDENVRTGAYVPRKVTI